MQFITSGNRIAVENFVLGDLYTITFTNGTYINSACIGIGDNFVTFQRNEPELLFSLTMATAELVSSIELYAGGSGTNNYNDLTNKPQINDIELVGNKSLSDLGIQATISDIDTIRSGAAAGATAVQPAALADYQPIISDLDTIRSGAAAGATAVQPAALAGYQPIISDLDTIRSGAAAGATAVQPAALAGYQPIIDSSHKLDADLVDDTTATHKFATAAQLSQIETNKNNILSDNIISTSFTWGNGYISTGGHIFTSSKSYFSQPFTLHAGEKIVVRTKNKNICIIGSTTADSVVVGDNISILRTTSDVDQEETYDYTATEDIKIVICVLASNYVAYVSNHNTDLLLGSYATAAIKRLESRVTALENQ